MACPFYEAVAGRVKSVCPTRRNKRENNFDSGHLLFCVEKRAHVCNHKTLKRNNSESRQ
ncbi:hypothetical protein DAPPUDRAFT_299867 [Daphnia pulex]|uniref:Uncharacterized protein n=1 Tax=Daphnia pulex TaxID=6669 RepID=E9FQP1_DAPPU|nr:hypothetical protein DAPPUDRAFT_299867 [Daphnia pulex]|eukprot:EFX90020.1 hypothetical protein DAPPUDRAFT_299867 [Daphnia pulex]